MKNNNNQLKHKHVQIQYFKNHAGGGGVDVTVSPLSNDMKYRHFFVNAEIGERCRCNCSIASKRNDEKSHRS